MKMGFYYNQKTNQAVWLKLNPGRNSIHFTGQFKYMLMMRSGTTFNNQKRVKETLKDFEYIGKV